jgi:hypothetical protein
VVVGLVVHKAVRPLLVLLVFTVTKPVVVADMAAAAVGRSMELMGLELAELSALFGPVQLVRSPQLVQAIFN